jgi:hypothetical protein
MLADSEQEFNKLLKEFRLLVKDNRTAWDYFEKNWLNCVEKWVKFKRRGLPLNLQETNNPIETINKHLKAMLNMHLRHSVVVLHTSLNLYALRR